MSQWHGHRTQDGATGEQGEQDSRLTGKQGERGSRAAGAQVGKRGQSPACISASRVRFPCLRPRLRVSWYAGAPPPARGEPPSVRAGSRFPHGEPPRARGCPVRRARARWARPTVTAPVRRARGRGILPAARGLPAGQSPRVRARGLAHSEPPRVRARGLAHSEPPRVRARGLAHSEPPRVRARGLAHSEPPRVRARGFRIVCGVSCAQKKTGLPVTSWEPGSFMDRGSAGLLSEFDVAAQF
jgi:hypothetical protein